MTKEIGRQLARSLIAALESPATVDRGALLTAAAAFLDVAQCGEDVLPLARRVASRAMDWAVMGRPEDYKSFTRAAHLFLMSSQIKQTLV
jgi:hypothetical protein